MPIFESRLKELMLDLPVPRDNQSTGDGVRVAAIVEDPAPPILVYDPKHPDADTNGYVAMPNLNMVTEMVDMMSATRAYEANMMALNASKSMFNKAMELGRI